MLKYTCKSVVGNRLHKTAHHFPPYHIGNRLGTQFRGGYLLYTSISRQRVKGRGPLSGRLRGGEPLAIKLIKSKQSLRNYRHGDCTPLCGA